MLSQLPTDLLRRVICTLVASAPAASQLRQLHDAERMCRAWREACTTIPVATHLDMPSTAWLHRHVPSTLALAADSTFQWENFVAGCLTCTAALELVLVRRNGTVLPPLPLMP